MAVMIPSYFNRSSTPSPGEELVFQILQQSEKTKGWTVLHSQNLATVKSKSQGEADFIVLVPYRGILVMEVKAHSYVARVDGRWLFGKERVPGENPMEQANKAMFAVKRVVECMPGARYSPIFAKAVVFTHTSGLVKSPEWRDSQFIPMERVNYADFPDAIIDALEDEERHLRRQVNLRKEENFSQRKIEDIVKVLRPTFELVYGWAGQRQRHADQLIRLTEQQYAALDMFSENLRVMFTGPAGTGKTLLALEAVRRALIRGERVLLTCHNAALNREMRRNLGEYAENPLLVLTTFHSLLMRLAQIQVPEGDNLNQFFFRDLPEAVLEKLTAPDGFNKETEGFDTIVVDELQDLGNPKHLEIIPMLLRSPRHGRIYGFGDLDNQAFFRQESSEELKNLMSTALGPNLIIGNLTVNCRNKKATVDFVEDLGIVNPNYTAVLRATEGRSISIEHVGKDSAAKLASVLTKLERNRVPPSDIAVLSLGRADTSLARKLTDEKWGRRFREIEDFSATKEAILATSVFKFKGLERPFIILTDTEQSRISQNPEAWYVGLTRSTNETFVLLDDAGYRELFTRIS